MLRPLFPYQVPAWEYLRTRDRVALFMKMRLGKTILTIRWAKHRLPSWAHILIVAPLSVLSGWKDELALEGETATLLVGSSHQKLALLESTKSRWILCNPEGIVACPGIAKCITWDCVILDEAASFLTNPKGQFTKLVKKEFAHVQCKAILDGEPRAEHDLEFFELFHFLHGELLGCKTWYHFRHRFFHRLGYDWEPRKKDFKTKLREEVRRLAFVLSAREAGVVFDTVYERRYVRLTPRNYERYREARRSFAFDDVETKRAITVVGWLTRLAGGLLARKGEPKPFSTHKIDELEYLVSERHAGESLVVWFRYTDEIRFCRERLEKRGIRLRSITGRTPLVLRAAYIKAFNAGKIRVLLVQTKCARFGLDFRAANISIFFSNWWDWRSRAQAEARIQHPTKVGQTLRYIDLITEKTYDEAVVEALHDKKQNSRFFLRKVLLKHASLSRSRRKDDGHGRTPSHTLRAGRNRSSSCRGLGSKR
jgi:SNF2 family DNA or RNA helicase